MGGDGGQSGFNVDDPTIRVHSYFGADMDVNFRGNDPAGWDFISDPLDNSGESVAFYMPLNTDPVVGGTIFAGLQHVWRTKDNGGQRDNLDAHCNEFTGDHSIECGDWVPIGADLTDAVLRRQGGHVGRRGRARAQRSHDTLWAATRAGRLFVSKNADAPAGDVGFRRIDTAAQPDPVHLRASRSTRPTPTTRSCPTTATTPTRPALPATSSRCASIRAAATPPGPTSPTTSATSR